MTKTIATISVSLLLAACGSSSSGTYNQNPNCQPGTGTTLNATCNPGFTQTSPNKPGSIEVTFSGEKLLTPEDLADLHHQAHEECYIANSLKTEITVETQDADGRGGSDDEEVS